jgi:hypothetical protein
VIAALIHSGWIRGEWPEDIDISALDLIDESAEDDTLGDNGKIKDTIFVSPPARGPMIPPPDRDLHVTVLILPPLEKYASTTRWGIRSRSWSKTHDGISFIVQHIKWISGSSTTADARGAGRRMRIDAALRDDEVEREQVWDALLEQGNGYRAGFGEGQAKESFVRGDPSPTGGIKGLGMRSWWKRRKEVEREVLMEIVASSEEVEILGKNEGEDEKEKGETKSEAVEIANGTSEKFNEEQKVKETIENGVPAEIPVQKTEALAAKRPENTLQITEPERVIGGGEERVPLP